MTKKYSHLNRIIKAVLVIVFAFVIYRQISGKSNYLEQWSDHLATLSFSHLIFLFLAILLIPFNLFFESQKWRTLVNSFEYHSRIKAFLSILVGIPAGLITPARVGEYFGRLMYISPQNNWKAVWSNLACSLSQGIANIAGGLIGIAVFLIYNVDIPNAVLISCIIGGILFLTTITLIYYNFHWLPLIAQKLHLANRLENMVKSMDMIYKLDAGTLNRVVLFAFLRYIVFVSQYFLVLRFWGVEENGLILYAGISVVFLIQSVSPLPPFIDFLARGEIALLILGIFVGNSLLILSAAFTLWIINLGIPALIGLIFMLNINISKTMGYD